MFYLEKVLPPLFVSISLDIAKIISKTCAHAKLNLMLLISHNVFFYRKKRYCLMINLKCVLYTHYIVCALVDTH